MKKLIPNGQYVFNAAAQTVTFSEYTSISLEGILLITNLVDNIIIYNFADIGYGGSVTGNVLTLAYNTTGMSNTDDLQIFYDDVEVLPATEGTLAWLKSISRLLKPLSIVTGAGSNRLSVDINNITTGNLSTINSVTSVTATQNQVNMGNVAAFTMQQALLRNAFANGIRANIKI